MRGEAGVTVLEAMIATALLATALVGLSQVLTTAVTSTSAAGRATAAIVLASQKIEELRSMPTRPPAGTDQVDRWGVLVGAGLNGSPGTMFVRRWTIDPVAGSPLGTYVLHVRVEAPGGVATSLIAATRWP
jgi:Tfp pilus assembly protein PilV